jgi:hypothetical protein
MWAVLRELGWIGNEIVEDVGSTLFDYKMMDGREDEAPLQAIGELRESGIVEKEGGNIRVKSEVWLTLLASTVEANYLHWGCKMVGRSVAWHHAEDMEPFNWEDIKLAKLVAHNEVPNMNEMSEITRNSLKAGWLLIISTVEILQYKWLLRSNSC